MTGVHDLSTNGNNNSLATAKPDSDDIPLSQKLKRPRDSSCSSSDDDDDVPLSVNKHNKSSSGDHKPVKRESVKIKKEPSTPVKSPSGKSVKAEPKKEEVWEWWKEKSVDSDTKWKFLEHNGPVFAPDYDPLPESVQFFYDGKPMRLSPNTEEVAGFYARLIEHEYSTKKVFNDNFFRDWVKVMNENERRVIKSLAKCDFRQINEYYVKLSEQRKNRTKEEKQKLKEENNALVEQYGFCTLDGHKQRIGNFRIEPPGLFRGRGNHPKMGMLKRRTMPEHVIINCSKNSQVPKPPPGHKWKEGEKDWKKYETARRLHKVIDKIRAGYNADFKHREMRIRQRAVALYFIDKLALRAGNEKDEDEADTVGCCSLRFEHIKLHDELNGNEFVVEFDFLGKDSIRYQNAVPVPKRVYKNIKLFLKNKKDNDDLFDRLNTSVLNQYLRELMDGLTAKVFRTYNASRTLEEQLQLLTDSKETPAAKLLSYNRANRAVAILCNHQRSVPKSFAKSMENLQKKIDAKKEQIADITREAKEIKEDYKRQKQVAKKVAYEKLKKRLTTVKEQLNKLQLQATDRDENKEIALGTSKLNYLDPRITVAWCRRFNCPIEKVYNKTQREKFQWAIDMATADFRFLDVDSDKSTNNLKEEEPQSDNDGGSGDESS